jgi:activator of HSP90 ATPase
MTTPLTLSISLPVDPRALYKAWLNSKAHTAFTGGVARIVPKKGGSFTAWDGYISGKTLELHPYDLIVQSWRSTDFSLHDPDSTLKVVIEKQGKGSRLTVIHGNLPKDRLAEFKKGWKDFYFTPMKEYFRKK